jgi:uncharacterized membrane protein YedE/YeeE
MTFRASHILAGIILTALALWSYLLSSDAQGRILSFSLLVGAAFGIVLQRGRFCFLCNFRDFLEHRRTDGIIAILVALGAGVVFYQVVIMAWVPVPQPGRLPPTAHISPSGYILAIAAVIFGLGMALSGSCLSGHMYRLGEGAFGSIVALVGAGLGFFIGFLTWNAVYAFSIFDDPSIWLPHNFGYSGTLIGSLGVLLVLAWLIVRSKTRQDSSFSAQAVAQPIASTLLVDRWPPVITGILVAIISALAYLRVAPLGVTAELGSLVRTAAGNFSFIPGALSGLDTVRGCISAIKTTVLSQNGVFVMGLMLASLASALSADQFQPSWPDFKGLVERFLGGLMMGWGSMTALGCTVGALLSGIHAGALSGWIFLLFCSFGVWLGLKGKSWVKHSQL